MGLGAIGTGRGVQQAVAAFGESAIAPLFAAWEDRPTTPLLLAARGGDLLKVMAFMVASGQLDEASRARIAGVARDALAMPGNFPILGGAIDLAVSLADPALVAQVEAIAQDPQAVRSRGIEPRWVDFMMRYARRALDEGLDQGR